MGKGLKRTRKLRRKTGKGLKRRKIGKDVSFNQLVNSARKSIRNKKNQSLEALTDTALDVFIEKWLRKTENLQYLE